MRVHEQVVAPVDNGPRAGRFQPEFVGAEFVGEPRVVVERGGIEADPDDARVEAACQKRLIASRPVIGVAAGGISVASAV